MGLSFLSLAWYLCGINENGRMIMRRIAALVCFIWEIGAAIIQEAEDVLALVHVPAPEAEEQGAPEKIFTVQ